MTLTQFKEKHKNLIDLGAVCFDGDNIILDRFDGEKFYCTPTELQKARVDVLKMGYIRDPFGGVGTYTKRKLHIYNVNSSDNFVDKVNYHKGEINKIESELMGTIIKLCELPELKDFVIVDSLLAQNLHINQNSISWWSFAWKIQLLKRIEKFLNKIN